MLETTRDEQPDASMPELIDQLRDYLDEINLSFDNFFQKINIDNILQQNNQNSEQPNEIIDTILNFYTIFNSMQVNKRIDELMGKIEYADEQKNTRIKELINEKGFTEIFFSFFTSEDVKDIKIKELEKKYYDLCSYCNKTRGQRRDFDDEHQSQIQEILKNPSSNLTSSIEWNQSICFSNTNKEIEKFQNGNSSLNQQLIDENNSLKEEIENLSQSLKNTQVKNKQLIDEINNLKEQNETYKMNITQNIEDLLSQITQLENENTLLKQKIQNFQNDDKATNQKFRDQMDDIIKNNSFLSKENEKLKNENQRLENDNNDKNNQIISLDETNQQLTSKNKILEEQNNDQTIEIKYMKNENKLIRDENLQLKSNVDELKKNNTKYKKQINFQNEIIQKQMYLAKIETEKQINQIRKFQNDEINAIMEVFELSS